MCVVSLSFRVYIYNYTLQLMRVVEEQIAIVISHNAGRQLIYNRSYVESEGLSRDVHCSCLGLLYTGLKPFFKLGFYQPWRKVLIGSCSGLFVTVRAGTA